MYKTQFFAGLSQSSSGFFPQLILKTFDLFDVFEQEERLGKDKKSLAISLIFENPNQTLTEKKASLFSFNCQ